jgi:hypothetical protein
MNLPDDIEHMFLVCGLLDKGGACSFLQWVNPPHPVELRQSLQEIRYEEIRENKKRRDPEYARHL